MEKEQAKQETPVKTTQPVLLSIPYLECQRNGFHSGELLNSVCLEATCVGNNICCIVCVEESHKGHKIKPLKFIIGECMKKTE